MRCIMYINMLSDYLKDKFGEKLYKLRLSSGMTCPNRDGKCGTRGCIFCSESGSGEFTADNKLTVEEQILSQKALVPTVSGKYIAYFQSFSNTYDSAENIKSLYTPIVERDDIKILSIATRPDCLSDDIIAVLKELNEVKPVWIELGLQTIHPETSRYIRRGYPLSVYINVAEKLRNSGITVITHLILGLPGESKHDMIASAKLTGFHSDGIKFHSLYIAKDTDIADDFQNGVFSLLSLEEYTDILCECLRVVPKTTVVHRLTAETSKENLIAPLWTANKANVLREIKNALYDRNVVQGEYL